MGNCATKPKVKKDSDEDLIPVEQESTAPVLADHHNKDPVVEKSENKIVSNAAEEAAVAAKRSEKGKEILIEDDVDEEHNKRQSLSNLFLEDKEVTDTKTETNIKTGPYSEVLKLDVSPLASHPKSPDQTFDVQTRNDLEVKIPKDSPVKTPETPKAKEVELQEDHFSENWEVKFPEELEEAKKTKTSEEPKLPQVSEVPEVLEDNKNILEVSEVRVTKESSDVPEVLENVPELSEIKVTKESSDVPEVLEEEDKNDQEVSRTNEVKVAESELLKVSEVEDSEELEIKVPKVFEVKSPEESEVKSSDQEPEEVPKFVDAQEKLDTPNQAHEDIKVIKDKEVLSKSEEEEEEKVASLEKQKSI